MQRSVVQRAEAVADEVVRRQRRRELEHVGMWLSQAGEHEDGRIWETAQSEGESGRGGGVEPLEVVDPEEDRLGTGKRSQHRLRGAVHGQTVSRLVRCGSLQRDLEGASLGGRNVRQDVGQHGLQQVAERGKRQGRLTLGRPAGEHEEPPLARLGDTRLPDRRLADARLSAQDEGARAPLDPFEQRVYSRQLGRTADDRTFHESSLGAGCGCHKVRIELRALPLARAWGSRSPGPSRGTPAYQSGSSSQPRCVDRRVRPLPSAFMT